MKLHLHKEVNLTQPCFIFLSLFSEDGPERRRLRVPGGVPADVPERRDHVQERLRILQRRRLKMTRDTDSETDRLEVGVLMVF